MNNQFDELTKRMAQSVTRRGALKKFGVGLAGMALACFGLPNSAQAGTCTTSADCSPPEVCIHLPGNLRVCGRPCYLGGKWQCLPGEMCYVGRCVRRPRF